MPKMAPGIIGVGAGDIIPPKMDPGIIGVGAGTGNIVIGIVTTMMIEIAMIGTATAAKYRIAIPSRFALCAIAAFSVAGCVAGGDEHGGIVSRVSTFTLPAALIAANSWCGRYGLDAEETRMLRFEDGDMAFACVPLPGTPQ